MQLPVRTLIGSLFVAAASFFALAPQSAKADPDPNAAGDTETETSPAANAHEGIEEIVVSARRRKETIQDTPIAITAVTTAQMEAMGNTKMSDIQGMVPNLLMTQQVTGGQALNMSLRGLSFADIEKSFDPTVAVVVDGAFIGTSSGQLLDFFDIASIEVLRGPQGTLFGRNTIGGVINVQRTRPADEYTGKFELEGGSYNTITGRGVFNAPLIKGLLDAKVFLFHTSTDGFLKYANTGQNGGGGDNTNFGASFLLTPSDAFNALLTLEKQTSTYDNAVSNISKTGEVFCAIVSPSQCNRNTTTDLYTVFGPVNSSKYSSPAATLELNWDLGFTKLVSLSNYRSEADHSIENVGSTDPVLYGVDRRGVYHQLSEEIRASGNIVKSLDYVAGLYFFDSNYMLSQHTGGGLFPGTVYPTVLYNSQVTTGISTSEAIFADFNWQFADQWRLNFGGRETGDKKQLDTRVPLGALFGPLTDFGNHSKTFNKFTPKVSLDYRPTTDYMLYASASEGYRSGGFNGRGLTQVSAVTPFNPETVWSYEVGAKTAWFDRRLLANIALFYTNYKDIQETITESGGSTGNITIEKNAANAKIKGVELDLTAKPIDALTLRASMGYLNAHFSGFTNAEAWTNPAAGTSGLHLFDYSNVDPIYAPKVTGALSADYEIEVPYGKYTTTLGYRYIAPYDQQIARDDSIPVPLNDGTTVLTSNDARVRTNVQNLLDASIGLAIPGEHGETTVAVFGRNLTDNRGTASAFTVAGLWSFATAREPRVYGVRIGYKF